jgi:hypothetical protein
MGPANLEFWCIENTVTNAARNLLIIILVEMIFQACDCLIAGLYTAVLMSASEEEYPAPRLEGA